jgi:hypothetical protein
MKRDHWANPYKPLNNAPKNDLAECVHAFEKARGSCHVKLIDAVRDDVSAAYSLAEEIKGYVSGTYTGGTGRSSIDMANIAEAEQLQRVSEYASAAKSAPREASSKAYDTSSTHRPDKVFNDKTGEVSFRLDPVVVPSLSKIKGEKRQGKLRDVCSKDFARTRERAITEIAQYEISQTNADTRQRLFTVETKKGGSSKYNACISNTPACTCLYYLTGKGKKICKHVIMILLRLGVGEEDPLIYQIGYTQSELGQILAATFSQYVRKRTPPGLVTQARSKHKLYLTAYEKGSKRGKRPQCTKCREPMQDGLVVTIDGKYRYRTYSHENTFYYHLNDECLTVPPNHSDISILPQTILSTYVTEEQQNKAKSMVKFNIS